MNIGGRSVMRYWGYRMRTVRICFGKKKECWLTTTASEYGEVDKNNCWRNLLAARGGGTD